MLAATPQYDLAALVMELRGLGYADEAIEFRSNQTRIHKSAVVESLVFQDDPRRAIITVNLSLLGPQSPLPTYFQQILEEPGQSSLAAFLNFFSHRLVRADVLGMFPEKDPSLFRDFMRTRRQLLSLLGLRSLSIVHWIFQSHFPELPVNVRRTVLQQPVRTRGMVLREWMLGDGSVFGGVATAPVSAVAVKLYCDEPLTGEGEPWARAAQRRLHEAIFPTLAGHGLFLEVALVLRDLSSFMILAPEQYLGYEPLHPGESPPEPQRRSCRTVILWSGEVTGGTERLSG